MRLNERALMEFTAMPLPSRPRSHQQAEGEASAKPVTSVNAPPSWQFSVPAKTSIHVSPPSPSSDHDVLVLRPVPASRNGALVPEPHMAHALHILSTM